MTTPRRVRRSSSRAALPASAALALLVAACDGSDEPASAAADPFAELPAGLPRPVVPADRPVSPERVELGRHLFYDERLSGDGEVACATCHRQELAFTDGRARAVGATGDATANGAMSLANVAYNSVFNWADPAIGSLEEQALIPLFNETPVEMGVTGREEQVLARFRADPAAQARFAAAFPGEEDPITIRNVAIALGAFERTLLSFGSRFDRWLYDEDDSALTAQELEGMSLFYSETLECFHCHGGFNFTDSLNHDGTPLAERGYHNTGLYNVGPAHEYPPASTGLFRHTGEASDMGKFRAPTLRNVAVTAPYMHDGSVATLEDAVAHYAAGGRTIDVGPYAGVGSEHPNKSEFVTGFVITDEERDALIAFLGALTDEAFLSDPRFADPEGTAAP